MIFYNLLIGKMEPRFLKFTLLVLVPFSRSCQNGQVLEVHLVTAPMEEILTKPIIILVAAKKDVVFFTEVALRVSLSSLYFIFLRLRRWYLPASKTRTCCPHHLHNLCHHLYPLHHLHLFYVGSRQKTKVIVLNIVYAMNLIQSIERMFCVSSLNVFYCHNKP